MIISQPQLDFARQAFVGITNALGVKRIEQSIELIRQHQTGTESAFYTAQRVTAEALGKVNTIKGAIAAREGEIVAAAAEGLARLKDEAAGLKAAMKLRADELTSQGKEGVEALNTAIKDREAEIAAAVTDETNEAEGGEQKPRFTNQNMRNAETLKRKKSDEALLGLKEQLKAAKTIDPKTDEQLNALATQLADVESRAASLTVNTAADRVRLVDAHRASDEELLNLADALAPADLALGEAKAAEDTAKVAFNALNRDYHLLVGELYFKAAIASNLGGFELPTPVPPASPPPATAPAPADAPAAPLPTA
jgi:hypothetical protein